MVVVPELTKDQTVSCNNHTDAASSAGAVSHAFEEKKAIPITDATGIVTPESSNAGRHGASLALRGFRRRWSSKQSEGSIVSPDPIEDCSPFNLSDPIEDYTPSFAGVDAAEGEEAVLSGPVMNSADSLRHTNHEFFSNVKWAAFKMPWESSCARQVFDPELVPRNDLRHDPSWGAVSAHQPVTSQREEAGTTTTASEVKPVFVSCIRAIRERTFKDMREKEMVSGLEKWSIIIRSDSRCSKVGKQIELSPDSSLEILRACMGVKSPSTVVGRANAMLAFLRWHTIQCSPEKFLPIQESRAWDYVAFLQRSEAPASRASAFVQSCRFAHFVLGVAGAEEVFNSGRIVGLSSIQLAGKAVAKQARPLTVFEMQQLHNISADASRHVKDRVIASHLLLMAYCRCRHSDTLQIEDVEHDNSEQKGYIQLRTKFHKGSKTAAKKSLLLPIVASSAGVGSPEWIHLWWENRTGAGLPVSGCLRGPLLPAPSESDVGWTMRPVTSTEISNILKVFLSCPDDRFLTSHSLKVTTLSWCSKGGVSKEHRRLLGRHSSAVVDADSIYARDLMYDPVESLDRIMSAICEGRFYPDAPRSQYWPQREPLTRTPVPPGNAVPSSMPVTPNVVPQHVTLRDFVENRETDVKSEPDLSDWQKVKSSCIEVVDISSSSSDSDDSLSADSHASSECQEEQEKIEPPHKFARMSSEGPSEAETWWKHKGSKIVHAAEAFELPSNTEAVSLCGRTMNNRYELVGKISDWTSKCRVCFARRRQP